ncbi:MAG: CCA tRNA nucleotidyltransferase [Gemmatimonadetes bacterium]|nr:CCA tRNA nucleotidyltransferase [Gemmatimonadota bacterium]
MSRSVDTDRFRPPRRFLALAERLRGEGFETWAVGGSIRDACAGAVAGRAYEVARDWDLATDARPDDVLRLFRRTVPIGLEHGTVGVLEDDQLFEVTTFRRDVETDGRHATVVFADTIDEDLERRDFTINAIAWNLATDELRDPSGGIDDLADGILRAVGDPADRFREDYLRVLRGLRFAGRFDLEIEAETRAALEAAVPGLPRLSAERVREELVKVLSDATPSTTLDLYATTGVLPSWYEELVEASADRTAWLATLSAVDAIRPHRPRLRLARWLVQVSDDPEGRADRTDALAKRLRFSNADRKTAVALSRHYLPFVGPLDSSAQHRRWLSEVGDRWRDVFRLHLADARGGRSDEAGRYVTATWRIVHEERAGGTPLAITDLAVDGDDVLGLGITHGPIVGLLLEELLEQVLEDPTANTRESLLDEARRLIELGSLAGPGGPDV